MSVLRTYLMAAFACIVIYTLFTVAADGANFVLPFLQLLGALNWPGQFAFDFMLYLVLSALWIAWRHGFSGPGLAMAAAAGIGGMLVFAPYVLIQSARAGGDIRALLLGVQARAAVPAE